MPLSGAQFSQIKDSLLDAYHSETELAMMVRIELEENLEVIAKGSNLNETIFRLIEWADANGCVQELVISAHRHSPGNQKLSVLANQKIIDITADKYNKKNSLNILLADTSNVAQLADGNHAGVKGANEVESVDASTSCLSTVFASTIILGFVVDVIAFLGLFGVDMMLRPARIARSIETSSLPLTNPEYTLSASGNVDSITFAVWLYVAIAMLFASGFKYSESQS